MCISFDIQVKTLHLQFVVKQTDDETRINEKNSTVDDFCLDALFNSKAVRIKRDGCFKHSSLGLKVFNNTFQVHGDRDWSA